MSWSIEPLERVHFMNLSVRGAIVLVIPTLIVGIVVGLLIPPSGMRQPVAKFLARLASLTGAEPMVPGDSKGAPEETDPYGADPHVELSDVAQQSLGIKRMTLVRRDFQATNSIPAVVVERPAVSDLHVVSEFEGIVEAILAVPGQAVREGDPLFRIRLTGESLAATQAAYLDAVQQIEILDQEIARLKPIAEMGGLPNKNLLQTEYERWRLVAQKDTKQQELMIRGLTEEQVAQIGNQKQLIRSITVAVPRDLIPNQDAVAKNDDPWAFTIEELEVTAGVLVPAGTPLCNLAYHPSLFLEAQAFERDVAAVAQLMANHLTLTAELGEDRAPFTLANLSVSHLDNHVDAETHTYRFYVEIENEVLSDNIRADGRRFRSWKFKPGQRGHVFLPTQVLQGVFTVPRSAVVADGLEHVVFAHAPHTHSAAEEDDHEDHGDVFTPVPVRILHTDQRHTVLATDGDLQIGQVIAATGAYQLLLATKGTEAGAHHHDH